MTDKELLLAIRKKLEEQGTVFSEYYGGAPVYSDGPKPSQFFERLNEGNYHVDLLVIPSSFYIKTINTEKVNKFLNEEK